MTRRKAAGTLLEAVARARDARHAAERDFRAALRKAHRAHSWQQIADVAGLSNSAVRYLALDWNERRKQRKKQP